ncbi:DEAD/DEAH box helicase [Bacillus velezensis]|uniref:DEAD/DEAH box helicase n=1 Tax=Bacillus velezensis TaxID=492670 RepID=UPI003CF0BFDA
MNTEDIYNKEFIDFEYSFVLTSICSRYLRSTDEQLGRDILLAIIDNWEKVDEGTKKIWIDLLDSAGFYPYLKVYDSNDIKDLGQEIRTYYHESSNVSNIILHREQKILLDYLESNKNLVVSAPTSFGKSLLIEEIVASRKYKNIVIIQPTLALIHETFKKLIKYSNTYNIIVTTSQEAESNENNIFILTAERVIEYNNLPKIDFVIIDEFYKLSSKRDDERSDILNMAANLLINKHSAQFYLLGPNITNISHGFAEKYNAIFYKTNYSLVNNDIVDLYTKYKKELNSPGKIRFKENLLFELLFDLKEEQTIIYCSSPNRVMSLSLKFLDYLMQKEKIEKEENLELIEWINENLTSQWSYNTLLKYKIGVHNGAIIKHLNESVVDYFNNQKLNYLFCTSTLIEGVNTTAKNVVIFDNIKGGNDIDYFDFCNIKGRSGRFMKHILGKVYLFNKIPSNNDVIIDIPFFDQIDASDEVIISLEKDNIKEEQTERYNNLVETLGDYFEVVKNNNISVNGQLKIIKEIEENLTDHQEMICWEGIPTYKQLSYILELGWDNLLKPSETTSPMTKGKLVFMTNKFGVKDGLIESIRSEYSYQSKQTTNKNKSENQILDLAILNTMQVHRHWLKYKVPKWLNVIDKLQREVCLKNGIKPGNYQIYASLLENDYVSSNLAHLIDLGVPSSAIKKIEKFIPKDLPINHVLKYIRDEKVWNETSLLKYERNKIRNLISFT